MWDKKMCLPAAAPSRLVPAAAPSRLVRLPVAWDKFDGMECKVDGNAQVSHTREVCGTQHPRVQDVEHECRLDLTAPEFPGRNAMHMMLAHSCTHFTVSQRQAQTQSPWSGCLEASGGQHLAILVRMAPGASLIAGWLHNFLMQEGFHPFHWCVKRGCFSSMGHVCVTARPSQSAHR